MTMSPNPTTALLLARERRAELLRTAETQRRVRAARLQPPHRVAPLARTLRTWLHRHGPVSPQPVGVASAACRTLWGAPTDSPSGAAGLAQPRC